MSNYNKSTNFAVKDTLTSGDPDKVVSGAEIDNEFNSIASAVTSKADKVSGSTTDNFAALDANGNLKDSGKNENSFSDASTLDGEQPSFYLDYDNFTSTPPVFRLAPRQKVLSTSSTGTVTSTVSTSNFGGQTPEFVMYFASAHEGGMSDLRFYTVNSGDSFSEEKLVLGNGSDDTDQGVTADIDCTATFVLPYKQSQDFFVRFSAQNSGPPVLNIWIIGYQI